MKAIRILLPIAAAAIAFAQPQPPANGPAAPSFDNLKSYLGLSDNTIQTIQQAIQKAGAANQTIVQQIADKHKALDDLLSKGTTDAAAVGKIVLDIEALRKQLNLQNEALTTTVVSFLTADQKTKLKALDDAAKLRPAIEEATMLHLLTPPAGAPGPGAGPRGPGQGMGPMGMRRANPGPGMGAMGFLPRSR